MRYAAAIIDALNQEPDAERLKYADRAWTGSQVVDTAFAMARALRARGIGDGSLTAWLTGNTPEALIGRLAAHILGAGFAGLPGFHSVESLASFARQSQADLLLVDPRMSAQAQVVIAESGIRDVVSLGGPSEWDDLLALAASAGSEPFEVREDPEQLSMIRYTSGSTGEPKGVSWAKRSSVGFTRGFVDAWGPPPWRHVLFHPVSDIGADFAFATFLGGGTVILVEGQDSMPRILARLEQHQATHVFLPPGVLRQVCTDPAAPLTDLSALRRVTYGGQPFPLAQLTEAMELFGCGFVQAYGQTEAGLISVLTAEDHATGDPGILSSVGRPVPSVEVVIRDDEGRPVAEGEVGEITVRSSVVMRGYWRDPALTATVMRDGWLYTRDLGYLDEAGYLHVSGRKRDIIFHRGFTIYSADVERALAEHPAVAQAVALAVPDDEAGEAVWAAVVLKPYASCDSDELRRTVTERLGPWHQPRYVHFMDKLPTTGELVKPDRLALAELAKESLNNDPSGAGGEQ